MLTFRYLGERFSCFHISLRLALEAPTLHSIMSLGIWKKLAEVYDELEDEMNSYSCYLRNDVIDYFDESIAEDIDEKMDNFYEVSRCLRKGYYGCPQDVISSVEQALEADKSKRIRSILEDMSAREEHISKLVDKMKAMLSEEAKSSSNAVEAEVELEETVSAYAAHLKKNVVEYFADSVYDDIEEKVETFWDITRSLHKGHYERPEELICALEAALAQKKEERLRSILQDMSDREKAISNLVVKMNALLSEEAASYPDDKEISRQWREGDDCLAKWDDDGTLCKAHVICVTGKKARIKFYRGELEYAEVMLSDLKPLEDEEVAH